MIPLVELGKWYRDTTTGFTGLATSVCYNLHGPIQVFLEHGTNGTRWVENSRLVLAGEAWQKLNYK